MTTQSIFSGRHLSELLVGVAAPIAAIAAYCLHFGVPVGDVRAIVVVTLAGAAFPVIDRFGFRPAMKALGLESDRVLQFVGRATLNAAVGLGLAVMLLKPPM